ncbi:MAG: CooT family nickel-binding protein [Desulfobacterales bacterium]|jgi:predicted RNA-binding protein
MCLSTVYRLADGERREVMRDVSRMQAEGDGYVLIDLFGRRDRVQGRIAYLDLVEEHIVVIEKA